MCIGSDYGAICKPSWFIFGDTGATACFSYSLKVLDQYLN